MFTNLNINAKIIKICARLNIILDDIFNKKIKKYKLLNMFKRVVNNNNEYMRFRIREIE